MLDGLHILLAEDNPTNQLVASQMLESLGATVAIAEDGIEARDMALAAPFDALLIDIEMPRMNGIELMRCLRATDGPVAALPMVALTAYVMREHVAAIDSAGADGVIAKPILSIEQLGKDLRRFMQQRAALGGGTARAAMPADSFRNQTQQQGSGSESAEAPETPGAEIDSSIYDSLAGIIGSAAMSDLLGKVESDLSAAAKRLETAAAEPQTGEVRSISHVLISVAGTIGAVKAQDLARSVNRAAHSGDQAAVRRDGPELLAETLRVVDFVRAQRTAMAG